MITKHRSSAVCEAGHSIRLHHTKRMIRVVFLVLDKWMDRHENCQEQDS